jgi:hypothetical protein
MAFEPRNREGGADDALDGADEIVKGGIVAPILNHVAGMPDRGPVPPEGKVDRVQRNPQRHMADVHRDLPDVAESAAAVAPKLDTGSDEAEYFAGHVADDAQWQRSWTR